MRKLLYMLLIVPLFVFGQNQIINGSDANISDYPWQIAIWGSLGNGSYETCGGSVISDQWIITAAHCVYGNDPSSTFILTENSSFFSQNGGQYTVDEYYVHPSYSDANLEPELAYMSHDIALVKIQGNFNFNNQIQKINLINPEEVLLGSQDEGVMATLTGWGNIDNNGSSPSVLQTIELPIISNQSIINLGFSSFSFDESMISVQNQNYQGPCMGDSGGPLIVRNNSDTEWLLAGVFSKTYLPCAQIDNPSTYISVNSVSDWISEFFVFGCTNPISDNYNLDADLDDGSCNIEIQEITGCINDLADNYNPEANVDDGLCEFITQADGYCLELSPLQEYENTNVTNITSVEDTIYYSGTFSGILDFGSFTLEAQSTQDVFIVKVLNCEVLWARQLTGSSLSNSSLLATHEYVLIGGNYGSDISFFEDSTVQYIQHVGGGDGYVLKLNSVGEYLWHTKVVGGSNEGIQDIAIDNQDNVYISGYYNGCCPSFFTATISSSEGASITINAPGGYYGSGFVSKLDVQGNPLWAFEAWARDIAITNIEIYNEHLYLSGDFRTWNSGSSGLINDVNGTSNDIFNPGIGLSFLAQYSTDGVYNWNVSIGNQGDGVAGTTTITDLMLTNSGDPIVCGFYSNGISTFYGTNGNNLTLPEATSKDGFIAKYKSEGVVSWVTGWGGDGDQSPNSMGVNSMNNIYIGGTYSEIMNEVNSEGEEDIFLFEMNDMGDEIETNYYGSSQQDVLNDLVAYQNDVAFCGVISPGVELDNVIAQGGGFVYIPSVIINQLIDFPVGWFTFSTYMNPDNIGIESVLDPIIDDLIIVKDNLGQAYLPLWNFNGIGDIILGQGYQIKLSNSASITVEGTYLLPEENPIALTAGWNLIGYLRLEGSNSDSVLIDIVSADNLIIAKDFEGNAYLPEFDYNGIGDMVPGQGYKLKVSADDELTYLPNDD